MFKVQFMDIFLMAIIIGYGTSPLLLLLSEVAPRCLKAQIKVERNFQSLFIHFLLDVNFVNLIVELYIFMFLIYMPNFV